MSSKEDTQWITIQEAIQQTGLSDATIRRYKVVPNVKTKNQQK